MNRIKLERHNINWRNLKLRDDTRAFLEYLSIQTYNPKIHYILLFGSQAREQTKLTSDIDIAIISDEPLTRKERYQIYPDPDEKELSNIDYNITSTTLDKLHTENPLDINYSIKKEGIIIYEK